MKSCHYLAACMALLLAGCQRPASSDTAKIAAAGTGDSPAAGILAAKPSPSAPATSARSPVRARAAGSRVTGGHAPVRRVLDPPFRSSEVARFNQPWAMTFLPDGRLLVTEKQGRLRLVDVGSGAQRAVDDWHL